MRKTPYLVLFIIALAVFFALTIGGEYLINPDPTFWYNWGPNIGQVLIFFSGIWAGSCFTLYHELRELEQEYNDDEEGDPSKPVS